MQVEAGIRGINCNAVRLGNLALKRLSADIYHALTDAARVHKAATLSGLVSCVATTRVVVDCSKEETLFLKQGARNAIFFKMSNELGVVVLERYMMQKLNPRLHKEDTRKFSFTLMAFDENRKPANVIEIPLHSHIHSPYHSSASSSTPEGLYEALIQIGKINRTAFRPIAKEHAEANLECTRLAMTT